MVELATSDSPSELPGHALDAASFAALMVRGYAAAGERPEDLFVAFAGLVSSRDRVLAANCLIALDRAILKLDEISVGGK